MLNRFFAYLHKSLQSNILHGPYRQKHCENFRRSAYLRCFACRWIDAA